MARRVFLILGCAAFLFLGALGYYTATVDAAEVDRNVRDFLNNLENAIYKMDTYRLIMESENWKGKKHEKKLLRFQFKKPNLMRTDVLEGKKRGSTVLLNKEGKIRGRNSWGMKKTLKPTDRRLKNIRGYTFMNSNLLDKTERLKEHILERGCKAILTEEECMGRPAYYLHIDHEDADDPITDEDAWFDKKTYVILKNLKYENDVKVTDTTWRDIEINIPLDDEIFEQ